MYLRHEIDKKIVVNGKLLIVIHIDNFILVNR